ncbi:MAG TPA: PIG-L family deacetylase [Longimicrobiales bacterium]|nr:PIG-L family deacetylase [Longimicrobiales bacterium]
MAFLPRFLPALALVLALGTGGSDVQAQVPMDRGVVGTALKLRTLDGVKRVLMIAAHPDDEDTALLTALARGMGAETAYLSLTRGDGGQNLIGPELGEGLGVVRTGELIAARELDGGRQFFTRAFDYGFSKSADEALAMWPRDELLRDVVWVIRSFRPHVIVSVFSGTAADGHGQHQAAGIIAQEGFRAAADPTRFPELARHGVEPWQALKLYQRPRGGEPTHTLETGDFDPLLGRSHFQLAMDSRSQHRSQDMGMAQTPGARTTGLILLAAAPGVDATGPGFFAGVDTTLAAGAAELPLVARRAVEEGIAGWREGLALAEGVLSPMDPWAAAPPLAEGLRRLREAAGVAAQQAPRSELARVLARRATEAQTALMEAAGVTFRVRAGDDLVVPGESVDVTLELWNGGPYPLAGAQPGLVLPDGWRAEPLPVEIPDDFSSFFGRGTPPSQLSPDGGLAAGALGRWRYRVHIPAAAALSELYFLEAPRDGEMYRWPDEPALWGLPMDPPVIRARVGFVLGAGSTRAGITAMAPARYVGVDKALGEFEKPVLVVPAVSVATETASMVWPQGLQETREVRVVLRGQAEAGVVGEVSLDAPEGWEVTPAAQPFELAGPGSQLSATFRVRPAGMAPGRHTFRAVATARDGRRFSQGVTLVDYPHIERTAMFHPSNLEVVVFPVAVAPVTVGYLMGSGDDGLLALRQMGVDAREVTPAELESGVPADLDVLVLGIRVYETQPRAAAVNDRILEFAREGGTVVVQYNKQEYPAGNFAPYRVEMGRSAPRVTDENSPVRILDPGSPVIDGPNRITEEDFQGWIQERGLYFLEEWESPFRPVLAFTDPGEAPAEGSLVVAPVGEGVYVYTGISFFRQLPAGVPGAHRLFANLVSLRGAEVRRRD